MSPQLTDFLTLLFVPQADGAMAPAPAYKKAFLIYLHACGIEFCDYGSFTANGEGVSPRSIIDVNMSVAWQEEYYDRGFLERDYVLNQAARLSASQSFGYFPFGDWLIPGLEDSDKASAPVLLGAADAGMKDGMGLIGTLPAQHDGSERVFWGFGMGGDRGTGRRIAEQIDELKIAAFALMDRLLPELRRIADGVTPQLSPRERDVLAAFAMGLRRDRVADRLGISAATVDLHATNLRRKLRAQTLSAAVAKAYRYDLL
jgi:DNA-binding CsgD family transcriptional regulator